MTFKTLSGRTKNLSLTSYLIDWDGESLSDFQASIKDFLYPYWKLDVVCEELKVAGTRMSLDFYNVTRRIAIEVQGRQHQEYVPFLSGTRAGYRDQIKRDMSKARFCEINNITLVEILPKDLPLTKEWFKRHYDITL